LRVRWRYLCIRLLQRVGMSWAVYRLLRQGPGRVVMRAPRAVLGATA